MQYRKGFDYSAECGIEVCTECDAVFYPMEVENSECPDCLGKTKLRYINQEDVAEIILDIPRLL